MWEGGGVCSSVSKDTGKYPFPSSYLDQWIVVQGFLYNTGFLKENLRGGSRGALGGQDPSPLPFLETHKLHKEGKKSRACTAY